MKQRSVPRIWHTTHLGQRIVKTSVAVFLCLLISYLRGIQGAEMSAESAITAIICMQPYIRDSREYAVNRIIGTLIGAGWALLFLLLFRLAPALARSMPLVYALMALGILISLHSTVSIGKADASSLSAIVFLCIVITYPEIDAPLQQTAVRILDVFVGTLVAVAVNVFRLPRRRIGNRVFFVQTKDLVPDRFSQISPAVLFQLNRLHDDGAKICLMSEHAPAFLISQMNTVKANVPMIMMDGAALFDRNANEFPQVEALPQHTARRLMEKLDALGQSYFIYTVHRNRVCIFHQGAYSAAETRILERMKGSPYRNYLDGEVVDPREIVYLKVIDRADQLDHLEAALRKRGAEGWRSVRRAESGETDVYSLYIYAATATLANAQKRLMALLRQKEPGLEAVTLRLPAGYRSEHDALRLMHTLSNSYEPVCLPFLCGGRKAGAK